MDQIKNFINAIAKGENTEAKSFLEDELAARAFEALEDKKRDISATLFGTVEATEDTE